MKLKNLSARSREYPAESNMDADYADDLVLLTNTPVQAKCLHQNLEQTARGIDFYLNSVKTELICFKHDDAMKPLKLVNHFTYLVSNLID